MKIAAWFCAAACFFCLLNIAWIGSDQAAVSSAVLEGKLLDLQAKVDALAKASEAREHTLRTNLAETWQSVADLADIMITWQAATAADSAAVRQSLAVVGAHLGAANSNRLLAPRR